MRRGFQLLILPLVAVLLSASVLPALRSGPFEAVALDRQARLDVMSAVVQIAWVTVKGGQTYGVGVGSGTIISADGLILTNCHVADPLAFGMSRDEVPDFDYLGVSVTVKSDRPPQPAYLAEVVAADPNLDLAVIRVTRNLDLGLVDLAKLNLPYVELGDSDTVEVGDELNIFGFPGIGGETITFTKGVVSGFSLDASIDGRAWIKTDATIAGGNSGGTGVNDDGALVGVPTRAGAGGGSDYVDCRPLADTNNDGRIDDSDTCVPVGGFINALRPVNLAKGLIEAARLGVSYQGKTPQREPSTVPTGGSRVSNLFFSPGVTELNQPTTIVTKLPSGSRSLYLFFDYENLSPSMIFEMKVKIDGKEASGWSLPAGAWQGSDRGTWWVGWSDATLADSRYDLSLYLDGARVGQAEIQIGGRAAATPAFSNVVLSLGKTAQNKPVEPAVLFPAGTKKLYAFFDYQNMADGMKWTRTWLMDGEVALTKDGTWDGGPSGFFSLELNNADGLEAGAYRLLLLVDGQPATLSNFWVTGGGQQGASFGPVVFAEGIDSSGRPVRAAQTFSSRLPELHAFSDYTGMQDGLAAVVNWYIDGQKVVEAPYDWDGGESGTWHDRIYSQEGVLPDGKYSLELVVEGQVLREASATIGLGMQPTPQPTPKPADGVQVQGTIADLDSGRPIQGALFLVLKPGITVDSFQWTEGELYTMAETDRQGFFKLPVLLERGQCYSMVMAAENYWSYGEDDICIEQDTKSVVELEVQLEKK